MLKRILLALAGLVIVVAFLGGVKYLQISTMISAGKNFKMPPQTVTAAAAKNQTWELTRSAVGSFEAVQGVVVTATYSGKVDKILFTSGSSVSKGDLLLQQDISSELAQLREAKASARVAELGLERSKTLLKTNALSQSAYDAADAQLKGALARIDVVQSTIDNKTIRAPFAGLLGIRNVNIGQNLQPGDAIVSLQALDPIFINFSLPQNRIADIHTGLSVRVTADVAPNELLTGQITAINPVADMKTRSVGLQAQVSNRNKQILPGMFASVDVILAKPQHVISVPTTAVQYAPYGNSVFVVEARDNSAFLRQQIVRLGIERGDFVAIEHGLNAGETVVTSGVFKLHNGQEVVVDNTLAPTFSLTPTPEDG